jgi:hypothetical protein
MAQNAHSKGEARTPLAQDMPETCTRHALAMYEPGARAGQLYEETLWILLQHDSGRASSSCSGRMENGEAGF